MNTEQMQAEFEAWSLPLEYNTRRNEDNYEDRYTEHAWLVWQACCKKQEDRIAEPESKLADKRKFVVDLTGLEYMDDYGDFYMPPNEVKARIEAAGGSVKT